jgi:hypothetical protein
MPDIGTLSALELAASSLHDSVCSTANDLRNGLHSLPSKLCSSICGQRDSCVITVTLTEGSAQQQSDLGQTQASPQSEKKLLETLDKIPKIIPKGMKWGDLSWYLIVAETCVFAVGYAYSKLTGRSLIVTWTGELPRSQVPPSASPDEPVDPDTWNSLVQVLAKLKSTETGSQTPYMEMRVDERSVTVSYPTAAGWVCRTYHVEAATVYPPGSIGPDMHIPLENQKLLEGTPFEEGSDVEFSAGDLLLYTPPGSVAGEDDLDQTAGV